MKHLKLLSLICLLSLTVACDNNSKSEDNNERPSVAIKDTFTVRFLANIPDVVVKLGSGFDANSINILYEAVDVKLNEKVIAPDTNPVRVGYDFKGWCLDTNGENLFDFDTPINANVTLYAKWERSDDSTIDTFEEPKLSFKEKIDDSIEDINITGVLNMPVNSNNVNLTTVGLAKLENNATDVKELLNYSINSNRKINSATFANNKITVTLDNEKVIEINTINTAYPVNNSYYETKAVNYEKNVEFGPYNVVLGGSSSMENWTTSTEDIKPITTINVGIGGTTVEQWNDSLAYRLIYPYNPREVVLYVGINNIINAGKNGKQTGDALISLFDNMHEHLPDTTIFYVLMNLVPDFMSYESYIVEANNMVLGYASNHTFLKTIDAGTALLKKTGKPNRAYFLSDGLHMSLYGYIIWGQIVRNAVIEFEKEKYYS